MDSILQSVKKMIGVQVEFDGFDPDLIMHINSVFSILKQLGVGPDDGFVISGGDDTWQDYFAEDPIDESVKSYVGMKVKMIFDPPTTQAVIDAYQRMIGEFEWRINVEKENNDDTTNA